jgi:hypothetical protein
MTEAPESDETQEQSAGDGERGGRSVPRGSAPRAGSVHSERRPTRRSGDGRRRRSGTGFYAEALDAADRRHLVEAASVRGIDQEIAVLRLRLRRLLSEHPEDFALAVRSIELLVRAVGAAGKLTTDDSNEVLDRIYAELGGIVALIAEAGAGTEL